jgi:uncharacterized membrane protein YadS
MLLAPLVAGVSFARRRKIAKSQMPGEKTTASATKLPPLVPLFVVGFLIAISLNSFFDIPKAVLSDAKWIEKSLLASALVGLGAGVDARQLRSIGARPLVLGLISWLLIATLSAIGVAILY